MDMIDILIAQADAKRRYVPRVRGDVVVAATAPAALGVPLDRVDALPSRAVTVIDSVHEWWSNWIATRIGRKTFGSGYSSTGEILAWDRSDREGVSVVVIGDAGAGGPGGEVDDHDFGGRWVNSDGTRSAMFWTNHGDDDSVHVRVSRDGTAEGFLLNTSVDVEIAPGAVISYTQVFLHSVVGDLHTFWVLTRSGDAWPIKVITVDMATGAVAGGDLYRTITIGGQQPYVAAVQQGRMLRLAAYVNPAYDTHAIWLLHLDMDTLLITNPLDAALSYSVTGAYLDLTGNAPLVPETATTGESRRLFYPHPTKDRVVYSQWARGAEDAAIYKEAILEADRSVNYRTLGVTGPRNGYTAGANYVPGACYSPDGSKIATLHNTAGGGEVHVHTSTPTSWVTRLTSYKLSRPVFIGEDELMWLAVDHYTDYFNFLMHQVSQVGLPSVTTLAVDPTPKHPLWQAGTKYLVDPTYSSWVEGPWPAGVPAAVTNLADGTAVALTNSIAGGIVERTAKGGLHVAPAAAATGNQSLSFTHAATLTAMQANPTHQWFMAESFKVTRAPGVAWTPTVSARFMGAISASTVDRATIRVGTSRDNVSVFSNDGVTTTLSANQQSGSTAVAGGPQLVMGMVTGFATTFGTSTSIQVMHNGGAGSPAPARVTYFAVVEDLTVSGRSYAMAAAAAQALHNSIHGSGGRYNGDTWTSPF